MTHASIVRGAVAALLLSAACTRSAKPGLESKLPVKVGESWDSAHAELAKLDPHLKDAEGLGARSATASTPLTLAGYQFKALGIAGATDRPTVHSVLLVAPPPESCDKARDDLVKALGSGWDVGEPKLGAVTATKGLRTARIVCTGAELTLSVVG